MSRVHTRRWLLRSGVLVAASTALGCRRRNDTSLVDPSGRPVHSDPPATPSGTTPPTPSNPGTPPPPTCAGPTAPNIEGPYYKAGAPQRARLVRPNVTPLTVTGRVFDDRCQPIAAAMEFWQADERGRYDNAGYQLRAQLMASAARGYALTTIQPGHYLNGRQYRPAHIHVKVHAPGFRSLTTQLYFDGDPYNRVDPFIHRSLIMRVDRGANAHRSTFDFHLARA